MPAEQENFTVNTILYRNPTGKCTSSYFNEEHEDKIDDEMKLSLSYKQNLVV